MSKTSSYRGLRDLPCLAGLCTMERAVQTRWSVEESVSRLKRLHYVMKHLSQVLVARIASEPIYELKMVFSHHAYILAEQVQLLRRRVSEMREPPLGLEKCPDQGIQQTIDEIRSCEKTIDFLCGAYIAVLPWVVDECQQILAQAHPLADAPTVRVCKLISFELSEVLGVGEEVLQCLTQSEQKAQDEWPMNLVASLNWHRLKDSNAALPERRFPAPDDLADSEATPPDRQPSFIPKRDSRFQDPYNAGVNPEAFLYSPEYSSRDKTLMMYYKRLRELDVPEMMCSIISEIGPEEPWEFYLEMVRQLWDEARHAMMGEVGFVSQGIDWTEIPINFTWSLNLNTQLDARQRHGVLYFIEQGLMPKTGKRFEWEIAHESGDALSALFQDFDWADEVLHAQIGQRWYVPRFSSINEALEYGDECWNQVLSHWAKYKHEGLTEHRNWWPELYRKACQNWAVEPDPQALAFHETYEDKRADLQSLETGD